jgi:hypothetical protein
MLSKDEMDHLERLASKGNDFFVSLLQQAQKYGLTEKQVY